MSYSGDVTPSEAFAALAKNPKSALIDVRTLPEWSFVGVPDLSGIGKRANFISWQVFPNMQVDQDFATKVARAVGPDKDIDLYFICRSGGRSRAAAIAMAAAGYSRCFNIAGGFEGDRDSEGHRSRLGGWKFENLPWVQE